MKRCQSNILFLLLMISVQSIPYAHSQQAVSVSGQVLDAETGSPLTDATIFIAHKMLSSETDSEGQFTFSGVPYGDQMLIAVKDGYRHEKLQIHFGDGALDSVTFELSQKTTSSDDSEPAITEEYLELFKDGLLGESENAELCTIVNPEVLYGVVQANGTFVAAASDLLIIENRALGFRITILLEQFMIQNGKTHSSYYSYFEEMEPGYFLQRNEWESARKEAYNGSLRHFLAALVNGRVNEEGFAYDRVVSIEADTFQVRETVKVVFLTGNSYEREMLFDNYLAVLYLDENESEQYQEFSKKQDPNVVETDEENRDSSQLSYLYLPNGKALLSQNGMLYDQHAVSPSGYMAWERLAESLPEEYDPNREVSETLSDDVELEVQYFESMDRADSTMFTDKFEYPLKLVMQEDEKPLYEELVTINGRKEFLKNFIHRKDQNPLLPINYWFLEFIGRYQYAREHYGINKPPYMDVRGDYYIELGKPTDKFVQKGHYLRSKTLNNIVGVRFIYPNGRSSAGQMPFWQGAYALGRKPPANTMLRANESWYYQNREGTFYLHFVRRGKRWQRVDRLEKILEESMRVDRTWYWMELIKERESLSGEYSDLSNEVNKFEEKLYDASVTVDYKTGLVSINVPRDMSNQISIPTLLNIVDTEKMTQEADETYRNQSIEPNVDNRFDEINQLDTANRLAQFRGCNGLSRIEICMQAPIQDIVKQRSMNQEEDTIRVNSQFIFRNESFEMVDKNESTKQISRSQYQAEGLEDLFFLESIEIPPQQGDLTVQIQDMLTNNRGFEKRELTVRDFSGDSAQVSDIQFYYPAENFSKGLLPEKEINDITVVPFPFIKASREDPFFLYFEIYNLNSFGAKMRYSIEITVKTDREKRGFFKKIFGGSPTEISVTHNRIAEENDTKELLMLDLSQLDPGDYIINIDIVNPRQKNKKVSVERAVTIVGS